MFKFNFHEELINDSLEKVLIRDNLHNLYIDLNKEDIELINIGVIIFSISYFDHYLTEDEFIEAEFTSYSSIRDNPNLSIKIIPVFENFLSFYQDIFELNNGKVYLEAMCPIQETKKLDIYMKWVINGLKEMPLCTLLFVNLGMIISLGYDFTHRVYFKKENSKFINIVKNIAIKYNLYIIE